MGEEQAEGPLRPARPRRSAAAESAPAVGWDLVAQVEELQELLWSFVDAQTEVRDGMAIFVREFGVLRAAQTAAAQEQAVFRNAINEQLAAVVTTVGDGSANRDPGFEAQVIEMLTSIAELTASLGRASERRPQSQVKEARRRHEELLAAIAALRQPVAPGDPPGANATDARPRRRRDPAGSIESEQPPGIAAPGTDGTVAGAKVPRVRRRRPDQPPGA